MLAKNYDVIKACNEIFPDFYMAQRNIDDAYLKMKNDFPFECDELFNLFFNYQNRNVRYYPADSMKFIDVSSSNMVMPSYYWNKKIGDLPYIMVLNESIKFLKQHNYDYQDRNSFVTRVLGLEYDNVFLPYLILYFIVRDKYSLFSPILMVENGLIQLSFEADVSYLEMNNINIMSFKRNPVYRLLVSELKLTSEKSIVEALNQQKKRLYRVQNYYNRLTTFSYELYHSSSRDFEDRIVKYLERMGPTSRKTLAEYFEVSDRKMAYALSELISKERIKTSTNSKFSPNTLYYINNFYHNDDDDLILNRILDELNNKHR